MDQAHTFVHRLPVWLIVEKLHLKTILANQMSSFKTKDTVNCPKPRDAAIQRKNFIGNKCPFRTAFEVISAKQAFLEGENFLAQTVNT